MAIATYTELQASVLSWMNRPDLSAQVPDFVAIAESRINDDLRVSQMLTAAALFTVANMQTVALPTDWLAFKALSVSGEPMQYLPADRIRAQADGGTREPDSYAIEGGNLLLSQTPDAVYTIDTVYFAKIPSLASAVGGVNWLLTKYPNIYLYGALVSACQFTMNDERANYWGGLYASAIESAIRADRLATSSGSPLRIRTR
ncbi:MULTISPECIES: hypothetical protein [unclassified Polaromonas]|jgi:hypothetical protein|uniref:phage adaptor protein n=1 Tax=unclassified Polaromonas TaxID=2638319 RepID=UPI000BCEE1BC|nr:MULTISPECIES: hypothetical protein [unclassified Polaromonas]OYY34784.1 MAG: hypothetical protein B7Y60_15205 [Polaromonas sp. 35-63-35]OYZ19329.1 MAG: hypothetical protein B7Y28_12385 [Polaromonas sp. 16-63-31]OYZ77545.1 MAG: hypothetical protein B7Y09_16365 [Polaromonas sp. 24-63-21]OZA48472.1 MAG: hypothetical protein B7X88_18155 [Polaromonas sp. 17-63-33]OZA87220.1 MAG: hypothetical protein B7X65_13625 [Polaromonas sp. 39-63-25]